MYHQMQSVLSVDMNMYLLFKNAYSAYDMRSFGKDVCRGGAGNNDFTIGKALNAVKVCIT